MTDRPLILVISQNGSYRDEDDRPFDGARRAYTASISDAGGLPLILPLGVDENDILDALSIARGVLLCGGADVDPARYGAAISPKCGSIAPERDAVEINTVNICCERKIPILGICRGIQIMNVALGGTLYQDLPDEYPSTTFHRAEGSKRWNSLLHEVTVTEASLLYSIVRKPKIFTNSLHHQGIKDIAPTLSASGRAPDELVEAIELKDHPFFVGIQWHPEIFANSTFSPEDVKEAQAREDSRALFAAFVKSVS